ncbi:Protein adenylyltransferase FICD [Schistosoma japonicum]|nr:Protein adenylyltransferase FICD [Schistosoma japonicum]
MEIKCGKKMVLFITFYVIILAVTPFECWKSLLGFLMVARKKLNIFELFESSTIYHLVFRFDDVKKAGKNFFLSSDPKYQDSDGEFMYRRLVRDIIYTHKKAKSEFNLPPLMRSRIVPSESEKAEALQSLHAASLQQATGHFVKARKLLEHAFILDPDNIDVLIALGEVIERSYYRRSVQQVALPSTKSLIPIYGQVATDDADGLILTAEHLYTKALIVDPSVSKACLHRERLMPIVEEIDQRILNAIDFKVRQFYHIPESDPGLRRAKVEDYFKHVYHSNAIEGNTLTLAQTRSILETRLAVGGKSLLEQNEVLGMDSALRYINNTLLHGDLTAITLDDILELHRRLLSFVDLREAGRLRRSQVFIADHQPPPPSSVPDLMSELIDWLGSDEITHMHPIELAALTHWKLVFIHPFYDGNGRTARLLMNLILMRSGFPPAIIKIEDRVTYYELLKTANDGDVRPFIRFIAKCAERTLDGYLEAALNPQKKSDHVTRIPIESVFNDEESSSIPPIFQESQSISSSSSPDYNVQYPPPSQQHAVHPFPSRINYFADPEDLTMPLAIPPDIIYAGG